MHIFRSKLISIFFILCALFIPAALVSSEAFEESRLYVTQEGAGSRDGSSWENATLDLRSLMDNTQGETEIWVASGVYSPGAGSEDTFSLRKGLRIFGGFAGTESKIEERDVKRNITILNGSNTSRNVAVVTSRSGAQSSDTCLSGFTVSGGNNVANGGGLYIETNSSPMITECVFSDNIAFLGGGGVYIHYSSPVFTDCTFSENKSVHEHGGGVSNYYSSPAFMNCSFLKNNAIYGGGMFSFESKITIENTIFTDNRSLSRGAGMSGLNSKVAVTGSAFSGNHAEEYGGGMYNEDSEPVIINCVFSNNIASPGNGGGVANIGSSVEITGCKFESNEASFYGGGMMNTSSTLVISGCVFSENEAKRFNGGGIANWNTTLTINDCHFSGNTGKAGSALYNYNSQSIIEKSIFSGDEKSKAIKDEVDSPPQEGNREAAV